MLHRKSVTEIVNNGTQVGKTFSFEKAGKIVWSSVGLQKWNDLYKVYIDEIFDENMGGEAFEKEIRASFSTIEDAFIFVEKNSTITANELWICKGQKIFNPEFIF